jgi:hypothetical protein
MEEHAIAEDLAGQDDDMYGGGGTVDKAALSKLAEYICIESDAVSNLLAEHTRRNEALRQAKTDFYDMCVEAGHGKFDTIAGPHTFGGLSITPNITDKYGRGTGVEDDTMFEFLRANGLGDLIKEKVHHSSLHKPMRVFVEQGGKIADVTTTDRDGNEGTGPVINYWQEKGCRLNNKGKFLLSIAQAGN